MFGWKSNEAIYMIDSLSIWRTTNICCATSILIKRTNLLTFKEATEIRTEQTIIELLDIGTNAKYFRQMILNYWKRFLLAMYEVPVKEASLDTHSYSAFVKSTQLKKTGQR